MNTIFYFPSMLIEYMKDAEIKLPTKACDIDWDTDDDEDVSLPTEIEIPKEICDDEDEISDYLSDTTGYCHNGFNLKHDLENFDSKEYPHCALYIIFQCGVPVNIDHMESNAKIIASLDPEFFLPMTAGEIAEYLKEETDFYFVPDGADIV